MEHVPDPAVGAHVAGSTLQHWGLDGTTTREGSAGESEGRQAPAGIQVYAGCGDMRSKSLNTLVKDCTGQRGPPNSDKSLGRR